MTANQQSRGAAGPMRPISKAFRARQIAVRIAVDDVAECGGRGDQWSRIEAAHEHAATTEEAITAAAPAMRLCARCPENGSEGRCALRAGLDGYTGLAAGQAWVGGRPRPIGRVRGVRQAS